MVPDILIRQNETGPSCAIEGSTQCHFMLKWRNLECHLVSPSITYENDPKLFVVHFLKLQWNSKIKKLDGVLQGI